MAIQRMWPHPLQVHCPWVECQQLQCPQVEGWCHLRDPPGACGPHPIVRHRLVHTTRVATVPRDLHHPRCTRAACLHPQAHRTRPPGSPPEAPPHLKAHLASAHPLLAVTLQPGQRHPKGEEGQGRQEECLPLQPPLLYAPGAGPLQPRRKKSWPTRSCPRGSGT